MKKILVSACLLGENCKYNGKNNYHPELETMLADAQVLRVCPELLAGFGTPRPCVELANGVAINAHGESVHAQLCAGVKRAMEAIAGEDIAYAILQSRSPTCGVKQTYDGTFSGALISGMGLFAQALQAQGIEVRDIEDVLAKE